MGKTYSIDRPVLIVDDEADILEVFKPAIEELGVKCMTAMNPKEGAERVQEQEPVLIITDYKMPEQTGLEWGKELREKGLDIPIILLTGFADKEVAIEGLKVGITELLEKPLMIDTIQKTICKYLDEYEENQKAEADEIEEIIQMFIEEVDDLIEDLEHQILRLEEPEVDPAVVDLLFRKIHSIKGGAGAIPGGEYLAKIGHSFESALSLIKKGELQPNPEIVNLYLVSGDLTKELLRLLEKRTEPDNETQEKLKNCIEALDNIKSLEGKDSSKEDANPGVKKVVSTQSEEKTPEDEGVFVTNEKLDSFMKISGELIVLKNYFQMLNSDASKTENVENLSKRMSDFAYGLGKITDGLQEQIMSIRKVRLDKAFSKIPRMVRQVSREVNKNVKLEMTGMELGVDKSVAKTLGSCMTHIIRNSIDHGLESTETRMENGKSKQGQVTVIANETEGVIQISVSDDGGGIPRKIVVGKAIEKGLITEAAGNALSDQEANELIFLPGFSTAETISNISGRGVGMDFVKSSIEAMNGRIHIDSKSGEGTTFQMEIPVPKTVMVEETVLANFNDLFMAVPLVSIAQITSCSDLIINTVDGVRMCQFQNMTIPLLHYDEVLKEMCTETDLQEKTGIIVQHKKQYLGLVVDSIHDQLEAVIRPFDEVVKELPGYKGTTVLSDDRIAYVISPESLLQMPMCVKQRELSSAA